ncbi:protein STRICTOSIDINE SYNTHASE-LIKE 4 isoform X2 [Pyrus x bretschneideri]|uniref:protein STRICTOSIDINE SYNTHASE-LIKE 4 isoform X2 n=1 Tax=Pyrus x bretschneideri TaxID=225117 RepID=UPI002030E0F7|nr:protein STRICTOSIDINE SYNTHASE-LIKE 4 isoform X2 [Pyrus x bretschneideri]
MALKHLLTPFSGFLLACLVAFSLQIYFSPISPDSLHLPPPSHLPKNNLLQKVIKLGDGVLLEPEDVDVDKEGTLYTATRDGWIKRLHKNGSWENWKKGLLKITEAGVTVLTSHVNGSKIRFADDVIEGPDGSLYFSVASTKFGLHDWYLDVLEAKPHGQLLKYDPSSGETSILLDHLGFANGVAVSKDQDYLVVCETWKFRCLRYWLEGKNKGKTEIFVENLPGGPDNINLAPDGSFWIALLQLTREGFEFVHTSKAAKHLVAASRKLTELMSAMRTEAMAVNVAADGKIIKKLMDPDGSVISFVTNALEFEDHLYLGSLNTNFIGKLPLKDA